jgi:pyruvate kinase
MQIHSKVFARLSVVVLYTTNYLIITTSINIEESFMNKNTKIVATIGPATESKEILSQLIASGMNVARFNTKHSEPAWHNERIQRVRDVATQLNKPVATLLDLQGPEIRINVPGEKGFVVKKGESTIFTSDENFAAPNFALVPQTVIECLSVNDLILLEDGESEFTIIEKGGNFIEAQAVMDSKVNHRKTMNTPGVVLNMPSLTERDYQYLDGVKPELVDFVGLSFVRDAQDIAILKQELKKRNFNAAVVSKIENQKAINNIDEIIAASDAIMVARGDLAVEVPYQELTHWQKIIIAKCRNAAIPVITATQMLKSMVSSPRPSRAEVSDVANAIYDGTDAVMLSEETTVGAYPVKAVQTQSIIAQYNERFTDFEAPSLPEDQIELDTLISDAAVGLLKKTKKIDKIICFSETGKTARMFSRFRLNTPIIAVTSSEEIRRKLSLLYGVTPYVLKFKNNSIEEESKVIAIMKENGLIQTGERIIFVHGSRWQDAGHTNCLSVHTIA